MAKKRFSAPVVDAFVLLVTGTALWLVARKWDFFDWFYHYSRAHETWELDEIVLAIVTVGTMGFIYALRRAVELKGEIERRSKAELDVAWLGQHDVLTRLPNRHYLSDFLVRAEEADESIADRHYAVYSFDLDDFREINTMLGQTGGDEFLIRLAERLTRVANHGFAVRYGADEFIIIAERSHVGNPRDFAQRIVDAVKRPVRVNGRHAEVSVSLGYALFPDDAPTLEETLRRAEFAMTQAQKRRDTIVAFDQRMEQTLAERTALERELAVAVRGDAIHPNYQPVVDLETGRLCGFEALARWVRGDGANVPPTVFIEMAEETGLIVELSENLLRRTCRDARQWPNGLKLSFNISAGQLADRLFGLRILKILGESGLSPGRLVIEVTESALVRDVDTAEAVLGDLQKAGVTIALDDFGTGYSSLSQLSRFAFDIVKIDRSFVATFETDPKQDKIIRAIIALSKGLGIMVTAEGIEEQGQRDRLRKLGCKFGQGYLFGKPMPADALPRFFAEYPDDSTLMQSRTA